MKTLVGLLKSKTFRLNAAWIAICALDFAGQLEVVKQNPDVVAITIAVTNILMRFATTKALHEK